LGIEDCGLATRSTKGIKEVKRELDAMIKQLYDISTDLLDRIEKASAAQISIEIAYSMLEAEIEVNLEILNAVKKLNDREKIYSSVAMLSTDALALVLFNEKNRKQIQKDFSTIEIKDSKNIIKIKTGFEAAFFSYRRVIALKKISMLYIENKNLQNDFRPIIRIENIKSHFQAIGSAIRKKNKNN
jgi:hypothetical protein